MKHAYHLKNIPRTRIATFDTFSIGLEKHHVSALLEFDVTESRRRLQALRKSGIAVSFHGWLIKVIGQVLSRHPEACAYLYNQKKLILFHDINVSFIVEKSMDGQKVPIPMVIRKVQDKTAAEITAEIADAKSQVLSGSDVVIHQRATFAERIYYRLPGILRRQFWRILLRHPKLAYPRMGNVVVTSPGMLGKINGWFIHRSVHPLSIGIGSILKKPVVVNEEIKIREILHLTLLVDHDVVDGGPMVRLLKDLTQFIETGACLPEPDL